MALSMHTPKTLLLSFAIVASWSALSVEGGRSHAAKLPSGVCWQAKGSGESRSEVFGPGCAQCTVGAPCVFSVTIAPPAAASDLQVLLTGPAMHAGHVARAAGDRSTFLVSYRIWDQGSYSVSAFSSCGSFNATWQLQVEARQIITMRQPKRRLLFATSGPTFSSLSRPAYDDTPCAVQQYGRWLRRKDDTYGWSAFGCVGRGLRCSQWIDALNKRGIREINFIGSDPQRDMLLHMRYLLTGKVNPRHRAAKYSFSYRMQSRGGRGTAKASKGQLRLNFYWAAGLAHGGESFGCKTAHKGRFEPELPQPSRSANVWFLEAGHWLGQTCEKPEAALASHLPHLLMWAKRRVDSDWQRRRKMPNWYLKADSTANRAPMLVYRSTPPSPDTGAGKGCSKTMANPNLGYAAAAGTIERTLAPNFDARVFDSWQIEAPLVVQEYASKAKGSSKSKAATSSCISCAKDVPGGRGSFYMGGEAGEADVAAFIHFLLMN